jgi:hypothetical protein
MRSNTSGIESSLLYPMCLFSVATYPFWGIYPLFISTWSIQISTGRRICVSIVRLLTFKQVPSIREVNRNSRINYANSHCRWELSLSVQIAYIHLGFLSCLVVMMTRSRALYQKNRLILFLTSSLGLLTIALSLVSDYLAQEIITRYHYLFAPYDRNQTCSVVSDTSFGWSSLSWDRGCVFWGLSPIRLWFVSSNTLKAIPRFNVLRFILSTTHSNTIRASG